jgi:murein DD-endopeptidase MepM/ murein hydrolase activator NlpD
MKRSILISMLIASSISAASVSAATIPQLAWPIAGATIQTVVEPFGFAYPIYAKRNAAKMVHWRETGIEIGAPANTLVSAAAPGTVVAAAPPSTISGYVIIEHDDGLGLGSASKFTTLYYGVTTITVNVGDQLNSGDPIASVAGTGSSALHFGTRNAAYDAVLSLAWDLPTKVAYGLPVFPEFYVDPLLSLP